MNKKLTNYLDITKLKKIILNKLKKFGLKLKKFGLELKDDIK